MTRVTSVLLVEPEDRRRETRREVGEVARRRRRRTCGRALRRAGAEPVRPSPRGRCWPIRPAPARRSRARRAFRRETRPPRRSRRPAMRALPDDLRGAGPSATWSSSRMDASGRRSARKPMRFESGAQNASPTSYSGLVSRRGRPPRAGTTQRLVNCSRMPAPSSRQLRPEMCLAVGDSGSPTRSRSSPLSASASTVCPSGDHSAAPTWPSNSASWLGSPPARGSTQGCDFPERVERKSSARPSGREARADVDVTGRDLLGPPSHERDPPEPRPVLVALDRAPPVDGRGAIRRDRKVGDQRLAANVLRAETPRGHRAIFPEPSGAGSAAWAAAVASALKAHRQGRATSRRARLPAAVHFSACSAEKWTPSGSPATVPGDPEPL